jgi:insertion element IS1 protein InsB
MVLEPICCPRCDEIEVIKHGKTAQGKQRYRCQQLKCTLSTFICDYSYAAYSLQVQQQIGEMAINGSGIRDTARVLGISSTTVINTLKKSLQLPAVNMAVLERLQPAQTIVRLCLAEDSNLEAEVDEMWSFMQSKRQPRWLWWAIDHASGEVLAYVLADRKDKAFIELKSLLEPFGITQFYSDGWGAYDRHIAPELHTIGKRHTQKIERKHLTLRTRIKRLARRTICFSKSIVMHDLVIGLFMNRVAFGLTIP